MVQRHGRAPSQRELAQLAQSSNYATRRGKEGALDLAQLHKGWADKLARTLNVPLAQVAPSVWHAAPEAAQRNDSVPEDLALSRAAQQALALAQQEKSTWTRADLVKYLGRVLPRVGRDPAEAAALLEAAADRILRSEFAPVLCLEAPEPAQVPQALLRADGRIVHRRHGGVCYAMRAQLSMEDRLVAQAAAQAAAVLSVLTDGRRVSVINAPAGAGKTRVLAEVAKAWQAAGLGPVVGITPSQSARNTLAAGLPSCYNSAQFLGHLPGQRGARGPADTAPGTLMLIDEALMMSALDLADLIALAEARRVTAPSVTARTCPVQAHRCHLGGASTCGPCAPCTRMPSERVAPSASHAAP